MTKKEARDILDNWIYYEQQYSNGLPINDCKVKDVRHKKLITEYTFKGLLCIAYDLKQIEDENNN